LVGVQVWDQEWLAEIQWQKMPLAQVRWEREIERFESKRLTELQSPKEYWGAKMEHLKKCYWRRLSSPVADAEEVASFAEYSGY
jgi:hypothetical protein